MRIVVMFYLHLHAPESHEMRHIGFLEGQISVPDDFDQMGANEIEQLFGNKEDDSINIVCSTKH